MKTLVAGSRGIDDKEIVFDILDDVEWEMSKIITGGARGVDSFAKAWAIFNDVEYKIVEPNYEEFTNPKRAPLERNKKMADMAEVAVIIVDGETSGSMHTLDQVKKRNMEFEFYNLKFDKLQI